jgi:hypothetical protein
MILLVVLARKLLPRRLIDVPPAIALVALALI